jgi:hypothetical protein
MISQVRRSWLAHLLVQAHGVGLPINMEENRLLWWALLQCKRIMMNLVKYPIIVFSFHSSVKKFKKPGSIWTSALSFLVLSSFTDYNIRNVCVFVDADLYSIHCLASAQTFTWPWCQGFWLVSSMACWDQWGYFTRLTSLNCVSCESSLDYVPKI